MKMPSWRTLGYLWLGWIIGFLFGQSFDFILQLVVAVWNATIAQR